ncbi:MAG: NAD/NADP octopine/nopaline dehydrogenase family protein [Anaerolineae bacterium]|jgi:opine dehydrogenase|nr:NAD/NADP octopine/nopaline dehydrogenase family protein [Anaerolineae bacterium]
MTTQTLQITVIGAGHGGKAMAAELASRGFPVTLYNRTFANIEVIATRGGIELMTENGRETFGPLRKVTADIGEALEDAQLVMVVLPASAHWDMAIKAAPYVKDDQVILLNPGRTGGALEFAEGLRAAGHTTHPIICEAETFIFASRSMGPAEARIFRTKFSLPAAAFPTTRTEEAVAVIRQAYPQFFAAKNVLYTSLNNMGAIFHPSLMLLNTGWIEATLGDFEFYMDGVTPATARVLETLDRERVTVASAVGIRAQTAQEWLYRAYSAEGANLFEAMHANPGYGGIKAPNRMNHRYIFEDVPCSLVPIALIGRQYGVETPTINTMVHLANIIQGTDYWHKGRTTEKLGIKGLSVTELHRYVDTGEK